MRNSEAWKFSREINGTVEFCSLFKDKVVNIQWRRWKKFRRDTPNVPMKEEYLNGCVAWSQRGVAWRSH